GQLMNEADIFVQLVPQDERQVKRTIQIGETVLWQTKQKQQEIMSEVRADLEKIQDIRLVVRDQSTEGFTAQRGDPVDFAIQGDWDKLPGYATQIMDKMALSGVVQDIDSDYRPGMPEVRIIPDR